MLPRKSGLGPLTEREAGSCLFSEVLQLSMSTTALPSRSELLAYPVLHLGPPGGFRGPVTAHGPRCWPWAQQRIQAGTQKASTLLCLCQAHVPSTSLRPLSGPSFPLHDMRQYRSSSPGFPKWALRNSGPWECHVGKGSILERF